MSVRMELHGIIIKDTTDQQVIILREADGERTFSMMIGRESAEAINRRIEGESPQRPFTHDLLANAIELLGGAVERIEITNLQNHIFYAAIHITRDGENIELDSRPSDAIALGIATDVPIFVAEHVLDEVC